MTEDGGGIRTGGVRPLRTRWVAVTLSVTAVILACREDPLGPPAPGSVSLAFTVAEDVQVVDQVRVTLSRDGATDVSFTLAQNGTQFQGLSPEIDPGEYTVTVRGLNTNEVEGFGQTTATVTAGENTRAQLTLQSFVPVVEPIADVIGQTVFNATWPAVANAERYSAEASVDPSFVAGTIAATAVTVTGATVQADFSVPLPGTYYVRARAERDDVPELGAAGVDSVNLFTGAISPGDSVAASLDVPNVHHAYTIDIPVDSGFMLIASTTGGLDPDITVDDPSGTTFGGDFDLGPFDDSTREWILVPEAAAPAVTPGIDEAPDEQAATLAKRTVEVRGADGTVGPYRLTVIPCDTETRSIGTVFDARINAGTCLIENPYSDEVVHGVFIQFTGAEDDALLIRVQSPDFDPTVFLFGPTGRLLASDDDGLMDGGSEIEITVARGGTYVAFVAPFHEGTTGDYRMAIRTGGPPDPTTTLIDTDVASVPADGDTTVTVTVSVKDAAGDDFGIGGDGVVLTTDFGTVDAVSDNGDGTYTATLTAPDRPGTATVTGTLNGDAIDDDATVVFESLADAATSTITADQTTLPADGAATTTITVQIMDATGTNLAVGGDIVELGTDAGTLSAVTDHDDGTYTATLTASNQPETATITGTVNTVAIADDETVVFAPLGDASTSTIVTDTDVILADGAATATITVQVLDGGGTPVTIGGDNVVVNVAHGDLSPVTDNGDGTYTTTLTATSAGFVEVSGEINGAAMTVTDTVFAIGQITTQEIVYRSNVEGEFSIWAMNPDGANRIKVVDMGRELKYPAWSYDATRLAFGAASVGNQFFDVWVVDLDGTSIAQLTSTAAEDLKPRWSPDDAQIAFWSDRDGGPEEIYRMNADGTQVARLTNNNVPDWEPDWTRDGLRIVFSNGQDGIRIMDADGSNNQILVARDGDLDPSFAPDGSRLLLRRCAANNTIPCDIVTAGADGTNPTAITGGGNGEASPKWSAAGDQIVFESDRDGDQEIYLMDADGTNVVNLTQEPTADDRAPHWKPRPPVSVANVNQSTIDASPTSILADGASTSTITVQLVNAFGDNLTTGGDNVTLATDLGSLGAVTDNGDGTYSATLTSAAAPGTATVTGAINGSDLVDDATVQFTPDVPDEDPGQSLLFAERPIVLADGVATVLVTVQARDALGTDFTTGGANVTISTVGGLMSGTTDNGDGTYTATLSAGAAGISVLSGEIDGQAMTAQDTVFPIGVISSQDIVFASDRDGDRDLWAVFSTGANLVKLAAFPTSGSPAWSRDGTQLAFTRTRGDGSGHDIWIMALDGSALTRLTDAAGTDTHPRWSPDDQTIVFHSDRDGQREIYRIDVDGTDLTRLTNDDTRNDEFPDWSPDGTGIVYSADGNAGIFLIDLNGTPVQTLVSNQNVQDPSYSPDHSRLAYIACGPIVIPCDVVVANADGTTPDTVLSTGDLFFNPNWSPTGDRLVFSEGGAPFDVYVMVSDGSAARTNLTNDPSQDSQPHWKYAPSGTVPAVTTSTVESDLPSIPADGASTAQITVTLFDALGNQLTTGGATVTIATDLGNTSVVTDSNDGTYTATLTAAANPGVATVTGTVNGQPIVDNATVDFVTTQTPDPGTSTISAATNVVLGDGAATATITVQLKDGTGTDLTVGGDNVMLATSHGAVGPVTDHANGTYSAQLTATEAGIAVITGTVNAGAILSTDTVFAIGVVTTQEIAWNSTRSGSADIWVMDADGSNILKLIDIDEEAHAAWSSDGTRIAFASGPFGGLDMDLWVLHLDGSSLERITTTPGNDYEPRWALDDSKIVFSSEEFGQFDIFTIEPDGNDRTRLTIDPADEFFPDWVPTGTEILFNRIGQGIMRINADGTGEVPFTTGTHLNPTLMPTAARLTYIDCGGAKCDVIVADQIGGNPINRTQDPTADDADVEWSPTGDQLVFASDRTGDFEIFVMNFNGSNPVIRASDPAEDRHPHWKRAPPNTVPAVTTSMVESDQTTLPADGVSTATITVTMFDAQGVRITTGGQALSHNAPLGTVGAFTDNGDGTYTATYTAGATPGDDLIAVRLEPSAVRIFDDVTITLTPPVADPTTSSLTASKNVFLADGNASVTITVQARDNLGADLTTGGANVTLSSSHGNLSLVSDNGDGTYTATLTATTAGFAEVTGQIETVVMAARDSVYPVGVVTTQEIVFASDRGGGSFELRVMNVDGTSDIKLLAMDDDLGLPAWSHDGAEVAFVKGSFGSMSRDIWSLRFDGASLTQLTNSSIQDDAAPEWSPDDAQIVFHRFEGGNPEIWTMNANGGQQNKLTNGSSNAVDPDWTADGSQIVYHTDFGVRTMNADGTNNQLLIADPNYGEPTSSPDGSRLAIRDCVGANDCRIVVVATDGTSPVTIVTGSDNRDPDWSSDGSQVVFWSNRDGNEEIHVVDADGAALTNLTNLPTASDQSPTWRPALPGTVAAVTTSTIVSDQASIPADGASTAEITVTLFDALGNALSTGGDAVTLDTDLGSLGAVTDVGDGTYTAILTSNMTVGDATITGTVNGQDIVDDETVSFTTVMTGADPATSLLSAATNVVLANGTNTVTVTIQARNNIGQNVTVGGDNVVIATTHGTMGATSDNGNGTYTVDLTATSAGIAVISATMNAVTMTQVDTVFPIGEITTQEIVFASDRIGAKLDIWAMDDDGSNVIRVLEMTERIANPKWSNDGTRLAFDLQGTTSAEFDIWTVALDGSALTRLTTAAGVDRKPRWSPDDSRIAFFSSRATMLAQEEIYVMNADGSQQTRLTVNSSKDVSPAWSRDGSLLVYGQQGTGFRTLSAVDGSNDQQLFANPNADHPVFSPDGSRIVVRSCNPGGGVPCEIIVAQADGTNQTTITPGGNNESGPEWSPTGDKIAFASDRNTDQEIFVMDPDGNNVVNLTNVPGAEDSEPHWKPLPPTTVANVNTSTITADPTALPADGAATSTITVQLKNAFDANLSAGGETVVLNTDLGSLGAVTDQGDGTYTATLTSTSTLATATITGTLNGHAIIDVATVDFVVPPITTQKIAFTSDRDGDAEIWTMNTDGSAPLQFTFDDAIDEQPTWAPDGSRIYWQSRRDANNPEIYGKNTDGTGILNLTNDPGDDVLPDVSPDGSTIVFATDRDGDLEIATMDTNGGAFTPLTANVGIIDSDPRWSPDGTKIVFYSDRDGNNEIYTMDADGSNVLRLTNDAGNDQRPAWSPDGSQIAFSSDRDGDHDIYVMDWDGSNQTKITLTTAAEVHPHWTEDGTQIVFRTDRDGGDFDLYVMDANGFNPAPLTADGTDDAWPEALDASSPVPLKVVRVDVTPGGSQLTVGGPTQDLAASGIAGTGAAAVGGPVSWTSLNATVATVDANGTVTALTAAQVPIRAEIDGAIGHALITVSAAPGTVTPVNLWAAEPFGSTNRFGIWGASPASLYALDDMTVLRNTGSGWVDLASGATQFLAGIWGSSDTNVVAVGVFGIRQTYDGTSWTTVSGGSTLEDVWGSAPDDVFAVGQGGTIFHFDGNAWSQPASNTSENLLAVWGSSATDVWAVGQTGGIHHYDGMSWSSVTSPVPGTALRGLWGNRPDNVYAVGGGGTVLHFDGASWQLVTGTPTTPQHLLGIFGTADDDILAVGPTGIAFGFDGTSWTIRDLGTTTLIRHLWATDTSPVVVVGDAGTIQRGFRGGAVSLSRTAVGLTAINDQTGLTASAEDAGANPVVGVTFTWTSSDLSVATVDQTGQVNAVAPGAAEIVATAAGGAADTAVAVVNVTGAVIWVAADGTSPTDWNLGANWSSGVVPTATDDVVIPSAIATVPTLSLNTAVDDLTVESGATIETNGFTLTVNGNLDAGATIAGTGFVDVAGGASTIQGTVPNLIVSGTASLAGRTTATGDVLITTGTLDIGGQTLDVTGDFGTDNWTGAFTMDAANDSLLVAGNMTIESADGANVLTAGTIVLNGELNERAFGATGLAGFSPSGTHRVVLNGPSLVPQIVRADQVGTIIPHAIEFNDLEIVTDSVEIRPSPGITTTTDDFAVMINGTLEMSNAVDHFVTRTATVVLFAQVFVADADVRNVELDAIIMTVSPGTFTAFDDVTFTNLPSSTTQLTVKAASGTYDLRNVVFVGLSGGQGGRYLRAEDTAPGTADVTVNVIGTNVGNGPSFEDELGGAIIGWGGDLTTSTVVAAGASIPADGVSSTTITVQLKDGAGGNLTSGGETVDLFTDLGTLSANPATDNGDGTYTATLTAGVTTGTATITANLNGETLTNSATVDLAPPPSGPNSSIAFSQNTLPADGTSPMTITVQLRDGTGTPLATGGPVVNLFTTHGSLTANPATDNGDGTYTATLTAAATLGRATISGTVNGNAIGPFNPALWIADCTTGAVSVPSNTSGSLNEFQDCGVPDDGISPSPRVRELFTFAGTSGDVVTITTEPVVEDVTLRLLDLDGSTVLATGTVVNNQFGDTGGKITDFTLPGTGTYTAEVIQSTPGASPAFNLIVSDADLVPGALTITPPTPDDDDLITIDGSITNTGTGSTDGPFSWEIRVDGNVVASGRPAFLAGGGTLNAIDAVNVGPFAQGTRTVELIVDVLDEIVDADHAECNGIFTGAVCDDTSSTTFNPLPAPPPATPLTSGVPVMLSDTANGEQHFVLTVPSGMEQVYVQIDGGTGDADVRVREGAPATTSVNDCAPTEDGNFEFCQDHLNPGAGDWYVMVRGFTAYSNVEVLAQATTTIQNVFFASGDATIAADASSSNFNSGADGEPGDNIVVGADVSNRWFGGGSNLEMRGLLQFNVGSIPSTASIVSATVRLVETEFSGSSTIQAIRQVSGWNPSAVTYDTQPTSGTTEDTFSSSCSTCTFSIASAVSAWVAGSVTNNGIKLVANTVGGFYQAYATSENDPLQDRPRLIVVYNP